MDGLTNAHQYELQAAAFEQFSLNEKDILKSKKK